MRQRILCIYCNKLLFMAGKKVERYTKSASLPEDHEYKCKCGKCNYIREI